MLTKNVLLKSRILLSATCMLGAILPHATAQTLTSRYSFTGNADGSHPVSGLVQDSAGNFYGTTATGGQGFGTVYKLDSSGALTVLYSFTGGNDGSSPFAGLASDSSGNLYGASRYGGADGAGTVFKLHPATPNSFTVLHTFTGGSDGGYPYGTLLLSGTSLYGTTFSGGGSGSGVVFQMDLSGNETVLYTFSGGTDGGNPYSGLIMDSSRNLYGTAGHGGAANFGAVYKLNPTTRQYTVLHSFQGGADGQNPVGGLLLDSSGNLYGTTWAYGSGGGTVFKVVAATGVETVLHNFTGFSDGGNPNAGLVMDSTGALYGTTQLGGSNLSGVIFKVTTTGTLTVLYSFLDGSDGGGPSAPVLLDSTGNLAGTTTYGGSGGSGTIFKLTIVDLKNVTVTSGQTVHFSGDVIDNNLSILGGTVYMNGTKVGGNISMLFGNLYIGAGTTVKGNIQALDGTVNIAPGVTVNGNIDFEVLLGSAQSQVCGATVKGNVQLQLSTSPVLIGDGLGCAGNNIGGNLLVQADKATVFVVGNAVNGNLTVQENFGAVHVSNNIVKNNLTCSGNTSITGSGNTASKKQQQCSAF
jgi:uncharacterized repeat protein (TIGR03803 family)